MPTAPARTATLPSSPLSLAIESVAFTLAAFASIQLLLWAVFQFDVVHEAFGGDGLTADAIKAVLIGATGFAGWVALRDGVRRDG